MGLFDSKKPAVPQHGESANQIPINQFDLAKRYDVYSTEFNHDRVYENVRFIGVRTFDRIHEYTSPAFGFLEIEAADGSQFLIPTFNIRMICEHGTKPIFKVLRRRRD